MRVARELETVIDLIRYATSRFNAAGLWHGHGFERALDEASYLVLHALHLPHDLPPSYGVARVLEEERERVLRLIERRIEERIPAAYLTGEAWFAGLAFKVSPAVLIPRSPIAELIEQQFEPWARGRRLERILDLGTGSGCIAIACAVHLPEAQVVASDVSEAALELARENALAHGVAGRVECLRSDLFEALRGRRFDLIVSNPPYVGVAEYAALPPEYRHEPPLALVSGPDGLDAPLAILADAVDHLEPHGLLVLEVGASQDALEQCLPDLPIVWAEFSRGGGGVGILEASALAAYRPRLERLRAERDEDGPG